MDDIIIGLGVTSSGKFQTTGQICVDGTLTEADVEASVLSVSRGGEFHGVANVERAEVFGVLTGEVIASDQIVLRASAVVMGKITAPYIITHRGAAISGEVKSVERRPDLQLPPAFQPRPGKPRRSLMSLFVGGALLALGMFGGYALKHRGAPEEPAIVADTVAPDSVIQARK